MNLTFWLKEISVQTIDFLFLKLVVHYEIETILPKILDPILKKENSDKSRSVSDFLDIALLLSRMDEKMEDKMFDLYFKKSEDLCLNSEDYRSIVEKLCEAMDSVDEEVKEYINLTYHDWMRELLNKALQTSYLSYERDNLIYF